MSIHPLALTRGVTRPQLAHILDHAEATIALGNGPTLILILGTSREGQRIEATGVIRKEDVLFVHARPAPPEYDDLFDLAHEQAAATISETARSDENSEYGVSVDGIALTADYVEDHLIPQAAAGYDVDVLRLRLRPGRPAPLTVGVPIRAIVSDELFTACGELADEDGVAIAEIARRALRSHLQPHPQPQPIA